MTVHRMLRDAVRWGRIPKSPADMADPPKRSATHRPIKAWTADTLRTFLEATRDDELSALWMLIATTGLRRGEALGLRWSDIDLETGRAQINQTVIAIGWNVHFGQPKTQAGRRPIALDPSMVQVLREHQRVMPARLASAGLGSVADRLVFCGPDGAPHIQSVSTKRSGGRCSATICLRFRCMVCGTHGRRSPCRWMSTRESCRSASGIRTLRSRCRPIRTCCRSCTTTQLRLSPRCSCRTADSGARQQPDQQIRDQGSGSPADSRESRQVNAVGGSRRVSCWGSSAMRHRMSCSRNRILTDSR